MTSERLRADLTLSCMERERSERSQIIMDVVTRFVPLHVLS